MVEFGPKENWLVRLNRTNENSYSFTSFGYKDILVGRSNEEHVVRLIQEVFGKQSKKTRDNTFLKKVFEEHEVIKKKVRTEAGNVVTDLFCSMASISGMLSNEGGKFEFRRIFHLIHGLYISSRFVHPGMEVPAGFSILRKP